MSYSFQPDEYPDPDDLLIESVMAPKPPEKPAMSAAKRTIWVSISLIIILSMLLTLIAPIFFNRPTRDDAGDVRTMYVTPYRL